MHGVGRQIDAMSTNWATVCRFAPVRRSLTGKSLAGGTGAAHAHGGGRLKFVHLAGLAAIVMIVAAAEVAVGLAIVISLFRHRETLNPDAFTALKW